MQEPQGNKQNPLEQHPKPPYPDQRQDTSGTEEETTPTADHGETSYKGCGKLAGRKAVITGASSRIGLATARTAAKEGASVVLVACNEEVLKQGADETTPQASSLKILFTKQKT